ncbi:MAG: peptidoglycan-binding domain-containing protein [Candidatus Pacebacteria bacterium]|nr:peptidoglycan-binding domain-containing protein [Candidatus Paceibacterota bacterium]
MGPGVASAITAEELLAQIQLLQTQLNQLMTQYSSLTGTPAAGTPAACSGITFSRNLAQGMTGSDVKCLQALLNTDSATQVAASGVGSAGNETTYFGSLTKAAVVKYQEKYASEVLTPIGLSAGTGYVGAKTIAKLNSTLTTGGTTTPTEPGTTLPTAAGLTVALASDNPAATSIISDANNQVAGSQALIPALKVVFSTPAGTSAKVTTLKLKRIGICTDADIPNAYLYEGDTKLAEMTSLSLGTITFTNSAGLFTVSGTKTITVKFDLNRDATAGKTIGLSVNAAADVTTDAETVNGTFPMNGNLMTVAAVADFGRLSIATSTNSVTVDPGTNGFEAMRFILTAANQKIALKSLSFLQMGSIAATDIANLALYVGGTQIGSTVASLASDKTVTFDLGSYEIPAGAARIVSLKVDVVGGSQRTIQFSIQRSTDVVAMDANYGVYVQPDNGAIATWTVRDSQAVNVAVGNLLITRRTDSALGNIALNGTNVSLAKFDVKAVGENIRVSTLTFQASSSGIGWMDITNVRIYYDGAQIGTTQTVAASNTPYAIPLTFVAPVGETKVLELKADVKTTTAGPAIQEGSKVTMQFIAVANNAQRLVSLGSFGFPAANQSGNDLTVVSAALSASINSAVGAVSAVGGVTNVTIGSYLITAGAAEGVDVSKFRFEDATPTGITATAAGTYALGRAFTNLKLYYGTTQLGTTIVPNPADIATTFYEFSPSPALSLAAGQSARVDLKADVLSAGAFTWANGESTKLSRVESTGKVTTNAANFIVEAAGQAITVYAGGTLSGAIDPSTPVASIVSMGDTEKVLGVWKLSANTVENITVSKIVMFNDGLATSVANFGNLKLYCGASQMGDAVVALSPAVAALGWNYPYAVFGGACSVPKGGNTLVTLKSDIPTFGAGALAGSYGRFFLEIPAAITGGVQDKITATGESGTLALTTAGSSSANRVYPYRTNLTAALACNGSCTGRTRSATDKVANLTLTGTSFADAKLRAALNVDDTTGNWTFGTSSGAGAAAIASNTSAVTFLTGDTGNTSVRLNASSSGVGAVTVWAAAPVATDLRNYSKVSLWYFVETTAPATATVFISSTTTGAYATNSLAAATDVAPRAGMWNYVEMNVPAGLASTSNAAGIAFTLGGNATTSVYVDAFKAYNDSVVVNVSGDATSTATGTVFYLKKTDGTEQAIGYYSNARTVTMVPSAEIAVGATTQTLELIADTTALISLPVSGISRTISLAINLGTFGAAGDFRWYDQAVTATTPITWMNGASPISVTLSLATGL